MILKMCPAAAEEKVDLQMERNLIVDGGSTTV